MKPGLRHRLDCFLSPSPLPADIASYSACDVEPLLDLRKATWSRIGQDHRGRFRDMCRVHLLRCLDPELARCLQRDWLKEEKRDVFIEWEETAEICSKADVYREVSKVVVKKSKLTNFKTCSLLQVLISELSLGGGGRLWR